MRCWSVIAIELPRFEAERVPHPQPFAMHVAVSFMFPQQPPDTHTLLRIATTTTCSTSSSAPNTDNSLHPPPSFSTSSSSASRVAVCLQMNTIIELPDLSPCGSSITQLQLQDNALSVFPSIGAAGKLVLLDVGSNVIESIPVATLEHLVSLETLTLRKNKIPAIPAELCDLPKLTLLDLQQVRYFVCMWGFGLDALPRPWVW